MGRQTRTQLKMVTRCPQSKASVHNKNPTDARGKNDDLAREDADSFTDVVFESPHIAE